ncbi:tetratricopeptide repeat protein [Anabaena sphaerica FACHB-251]|uniref:Tetratricopeptide repeat protein n=1 Tax=Anabaena sphaerica FACHB-251 TaxID=2692883 RepID=A0A926WIR6_9NOST|nr:tetratricopeptide repeat protein [Anabaena sphaerica]MBD2294206.1 tetratricopeptide repeat protein [Anabaena sphaerica FACHB-251]
MITLYLDLKAVAGNYVELRYFTDNYNKYEKRTLPLSEITDLIEIAERDYYVSSFAEDYAVTGSRLYNWLDGSDRWLQKLINQYQRQGIILAIATAEKLAHLPWEVLHDHNSFLVQRSIIPIRWVSSDSVKTLSVEKNPENRALQVLFMATSPQGVEPVLDYEAEEARILEATGRQPLALTVEESGCLSELRYLVDYYGKDYFDIFHITGHATITNGQPEFITETETGAAYNASAEDIATALQFRLPKLIFLSGCRTGQAGSKDDNYGSVPSMAEELLKAGAKAVLGWGQKVLESDATEAAATLYKELAAGKQITEAVASTYQTLIKNKARDWHLLRLYAADSLPGELVTPLRTPGRKPAPLLSVSTEFFDPAGRVKVPTRESFVGRRRQLQSCLRTLTQSTEEIGVLIYGMGGLGKSSLAARLCDRLPHFQCVVLVGRIDEPSLVSELVKKLDDNEQRKQLQNPDEELRFRFKRVFQQLSDAGEKPFLLVLDDFEDNLEPRQDSFVLKTAAAEVLTALVWAIRETYTNHRLILTCRYDFEFSQLRYFYKQPLEGMRGADLRKKCSRLEAFGAKSQVDEALKSQARRLADGNPRLLEWLDKILQAPHSPHPLAPSPQARRGDKSFDVDVVVILNRLEVDAVELREQVLAEALLQQMDETMGEMLSQGLVFELPVPREALTAVCENIPNLENYINRAVALGLLEVSPDESLRVPRILPLTLSTHVETLHQQGAEVLCRLWWKEGETRTEEEVLEIHRLALLAKKGEIASKVGSVLASNWRKKSRFREALYLCKSTLNIVDDYHILHQLARSEQELGEIEQAEQHYQQALKLCPVTDEKTKAAIINNLANIFVQQGRVNIALNLFSQSLEITKRIRDFNGQAAILHNISNINIANKNFEEAIQNLDEIIQIDESQNNFLGKAKTFNSRANIYYEQDQFEKALEYFQKSFAIFKNQNDIQGQITALHNIVNIYQRQGNHKYARVILSQALQNAKDSGAMYIQAAILNSMAFTYDKQDGFDEKIICFEEAFKIAQYIQDVNAQATTLGNMASINAKQGNTEEAITQFKQLLALELHENNENFTLKARTLAMLGQLLAYQKRDFVTALEYLQQSLEILQRIQSPDAETVRRIIKRVQQMANG